MSSKQSAVIKPLAEEVPDLAGVFFLPKAQPIPCSPHLLFFFSLQHLNMLVMLCCGKQMHSCYGQRWMWGLNEHPWKSLLFDLRCPTVELWQQPPFGKLTVSLCTRSNHGITWMTNMPLFTWQLTKSIVSFYSKALKSSQFKNPKHVKARYMWNAVAFYFY